MGQWLAAHGRSIRDRLPADLIQREVLLKYCRALVIYGDMHFQRHNLLANYVETDPNAPTSVWTVKPAQVLRSTSYFGWMKTTQYRPLCLLDG